MTTIVKEFEQLGIHGAISGLSAAGLSMAAGASGSIDIYGVSVPLPLLAGAMGVTSSVVQKATRDNIIPMVTSDPDISTVLYLIEPAVQGAAFVGIDLTLSYLLGGGSAYNMNDALTSFTIGALSSVIANFAANPVGNLVDDTF